MQQGCKIWKCVIWDFKLDGGISPDPQIFKLNDAFKGYAYQKCINGGSFCDIEEKLLLFWFVFVKKIIQRKVLLCQNAFPAVTASSFCLFFFFLKNVYSFPLPPPASFLSPGLSAWSSKPSRLSTHLSSTATSRTSPPWAPLSKTAPSSTPSFTTRVSVRSSAAERSSPLPYACWGVSFHPRKSHYAEGAVHISLTQSPSDSSFGL